MIPDKNKPETINDLLIALQEISFMYRYHMKVEEDEEGSLINHKLK